jgi:release factor glutamine methyltransferase
MRREDLLLHCDEEAAENVPENYRRLLKRRLDGECVAYILGAKEFYGLEFSVNPCVLVPRPDTETLVEAALELTKLAQRRICTGVKPEKIRLLDLCTGSGAIAIAIKHKMPETAVCASDISREALKLAKTNAERILREEPDRSSARGTVEFIQSDLFENIPGKFHLIVSNPPYIPKGEIETLAPELRREPRIALDGGADGLEITGKIISRSQDYLLSGGSLLLEAAPEQMPEIRILLENLNFGDIKTFKDLAGRERVIAAKSR